MWRATKTMAGAPGFEPGMTVPKTVALPLGDAPPQDFGSACAAKSTPD